MNNSSEVPDKLKNLIEKELILFENLVDHIYNYKINIDINFNFRNKIQSIVESNNFNKTHLSEKLIECLYMLIKENPIVNKLEDVELLGKPLYKVSDFDNELFENKPIDMERNKRIVESLEQELFDEFKDLERNITLNIKEKEELVKQSEPTNVVKQPVFRQPVFRQPVFRQSVVKQPVFRQPVVKQRVVKQPVFIKSKPKPQVLKQNPKPSVQHKKHNYGNMFRLR